jgi:type IV pilus assembly protein PilX
MSHIRTEARLAHPRRERGMALITGLLLLLVVTIIAMSMFRSFGMQEKIAGNTREKDRALNAAISAQQFAENWLLSGSAPVSGGTCAAGYVSSNIGEVCNNLPDNGFAAAPWTIGGSPAAVTFDSFTYPTITISGPLGTPSQGSWVRVPQYYITFLGQVGGNTFYQIDAAGWAGTPNSVAVVESTYELQQSGNSLDK